MSILQMRFCDFDVIRSRDNACWQFEQFRVVQKSPIRAVAPFSKNINREMRKIFILANKHNVIR